MITPDFEFGIVGTGFAGIIAALRLQESGRQSFVMLERAHGVGGTWRDNTYPGCACDVPTSLYSITSEPKPDWSRSYGGQQEILAYLQGVVRKHNLEQRIQYGFDVLRSEFLEDEGLWRITARDGRSLVVRHLMAGWGPFSRPKLPHLPGRDGFLGASLHSAKWDHGVKLDGVTLDLLGRARKVVVTKDNTTIIEGAGEESEVKGRIAQIKREIDDTDSDWDREKLQERLAKLAGGVAVVRVGAATEVELKEKKHRIEDAVSTTKAAIEEGVVPGGGVALVRSLPAVEAVAASLEGDEATGARIVARSLTAPLKQIAENAGMEGGVVIDKVRSLSGSEGLNAATGEYTDLVKLGVIDAAKVTRSALQNAASIAALFLTTEVVIADAPEKKAGGGGGGMPDMDF